MDYKLILIYKRTCNLQVRLYQKNAKKFDIAFDVKFYISPNYFNKLREFLKVKIEKAIKEQNSKTTT